MSDLHGMTAFVTGGSRGIGRAAVLRLAELGCNVVSTYRERADCAQEVTDRALSESGGRVSFLRCDVSDPLAVRNTVELALSTLGEIDILVNNAGMARDGLFLSMSIEDWDTVIRVNLTSAFLTCSGIVGHMASRGYGRIINVSSIMALAGNTGQANYCAAKAGLLGLTRALAREYAGTGITVNAVAPGLVDTDMTRSIPAYIAKRLISQIPEGRLGSPEEVAAVIAFLASREASYITGQVMNVSGGYHI